MKIRRRQRRGTRVVVGYARCIGYAENGNICGRPAGTLDLARGGMVCDLHAPGRNRGGGGGGQAPASDTGTHETGD
jgi:hypothetical protein